MLQTHVDTRRIRNAAIWASRQRVVTRVGAAAADAGVDLLVFKGVHLAYHLYPDPLDRPCADVDLLVRPAHRQRFLDVLERLGFIACASNIGDLALGQTSFELVRVPGSVLDVHSRLVTPFGIARRFAFDDLWERATPFVLSPNVRVPCRLDALRIALVHSHVHHPGEQADDWILDVRLLVEGMSEEELQRFRVWVSDGTIPAGCHRLLQEAVSRVPGERGRSIAALLDPDEVPTRQRPGRDIRDLRHIPPRMAARVVAAHLFPSAPYMRTTYAPASRLPLALLYALRIVRGVTRAATAPLAR